MRHRPGVTLIEVLTAMFIMAIGMLALLTLFPLGALSMGQALRDDRAASAASVAANQAVAFDIWHDPLIIGATPSTPFNGGPGNLFINPGNGLPALPATYTGPSYPVYVDPFGVQSGLGPIGAGVSAGIPRTTLSFLGGATAGQTDRFCTLLDDISFANNGLPDTSAVGAGGVERAGRFTWAYLLRRRNAWEDSNVEVYVVVYNGRDIGGLTQEPGLAAAGQGGSTSIDFSQAVDVRRGAWLLDVTFAPIPNNSGTAPYNAPVPAPATQTAFGPPAVIQGYFYQVINTTNAGGVTTVDVQPALRADVNAVVIMNDVHAVFERGVSFQP